MKFMIDILRRTKKNKFISINKPRDFAIKMYRINSEKLLLFSMNQLIVGVFYLVDLLQYENIEME